MQIPSSVLIFWQFFKRDIHVHVKNIQDYILNYVISFPILFGITFAFLMGRIYFEKGADASGTLLFAGNIIIVLMLLTYKEAITLLFDLKGSRIIDYQITLMHPRLVILERIVFSALFTFIMSLPFFPVAKLVLWSHFDTSNASWPALILMLFFGSFCVASYHQCAALVLESPEQISSLWARMNNVLISFGGFWVPWYAIYQYDPLLGSIVRINPILYITEGIRQALIGGDQFFGIAHCVAMLSLFTCIFILASWYLFKKRVDHI